MTREAIIEAAAKALYIRRKGHGGTQWEDIHTTHREPYRKDVRAVMAAIEAAGMAVVPVEVSDNMLVPLVDLTKCDVYAIYDRMIAAGKI